MVHNGIMREYELGDNKSDTVHFVDIILKPLYKTFGGIKNKQCFADDYVTSELLGGYIGSFNKFVIMSPHKVYIINENSGAWNTLEDGKKFWASNDGWKPIPKYTPQSGLYSGYTGGRSYQDGYYDAAGNWHRYAGAVESKKKTEESVVQMVEMTGQSRKPETHSSGQTTSNTAAGVPSVIQQSLPTSSSKTTECATNAQGRGQDNKKGIVISYRESTMFPGSLVASYDFLGKKEDILLKRVYDKDGFPVWEIMLSELLYGKEADLESGVLIYKTLPDAKVAIYQTLKGVINAIEAECVDCG